MAGLSPQQLHKQLVDRFSEGELRELCLELDIPHYDLAGGTHSERCLSLVEYGQRHEKYDVLVAYVKRARPSHDQSQFPLHRLPHPQNPNFTGREPELAQLHQNLSAGQTAVVMQAIVGLGGVGKTQLVLAYAHRHRDAYELLWWLRATVEAARQREAEEIVTAVTQAIQTHAGNAPQFDDITLVVMKR